MRFDVGLNGMSDIAQSRPGLDLRDSSPQCFTGNVGDTFPLYVRFADMKHSAAVPVKPVFDNSYIDIDHISVTQFAIPGDAVADHMIYRSADGLGKATVI